MFCLVCPFYSLCYAWKRINVVIGCKGCGICKDKEVRQRCTRGRYDPRRSSVKFSKLFVTDSWRFLCNETIRLGIVVNVERQIVGTENDFAVAVDEDIGKRTGTETIDPLRVSLTWVEWRGVRGGSQKGR